MALKCDQPRDIAFDRAPAKLWREATTVYMTSGHGGCRPYGIAVALARHGLPSKFTLRAARPIFWSVRGREKAAGDESRQSTFQTEAAELGIPVHHNRLSADGMRAALSTVT
ncbi:MAG: peptidase C39 family protein [Rhodobiaceae bacterium]|nr:peptidase C39 family protein [Rhodobiaceae bacterium]